VTQENHKNLNQDSLYPDLGMNTGPPEYETGVRRAGRDVGFEADTVPRLQHIKKDVRQIGY
jgi:hypothetical protein